MAALCLVTFDSLTAQDDPPAPPTDATPPTGAAAAEGQGETSSPEQAVLAALQTKVTTEFQEQPLDEVLNWLASKAGVNLWIDKDALEEDGILRDEPTTADLRGVSIETALECILPDLGATWYVDENVLIVTTDLAAEDRLITRVYAVGHVLQAGDEDAEPKEEKPNAARAAAGSTQTVQFDGGGGFGGSSVVLNCGGTFDPFDESEPFERLMSAVTRVTDGPWFHTDGAGGTMSPLPDKDLLIVSQTWHQQRQVAQLLSVLETISNEDGERKSITLHPPGYPVEADERIRAALTKSLIVDFKNHPLNSLMEELDQRTGIQIRLDENRLEEDG
ncbi:MAG: hypothetical protein ACREIV_16800, partial [Planctomycetaceae bacterium]